MPGTDSQPPGCRLPPGAGFGGSAESDLGTVAQHGPQAAATASLSAGSLTEGCFHGSCVQPQVLLYKCVLSFSAWEGGSQPHKASFSGAKRTDQ